MHFLETAPNVLIPPWKKTHFLTYDSNNHNQVWFVPEPHSYLTTFTTKSPQQLRHCLGMTCKL